MDEICVSRRIYRFDWDPDKAVANRKKHDVDFASAVTVFDDPLALSQYDFGHSEIEERWATIGKTLPGTVLVVIHTFNEADPGEMVIRIISAREATKNERMQYEKIAYGIQETMKPEYDFSNAERGKFYRKDAALELPIHIDFEVRARLKQQADARGMSLSALANELLRLGLEPCNR